MAIQMGPYVYSASKHDMNSPYKVTDFTSLIMEIFTPHLPALSPKLYCVMILVLTKHLLVHIVAVWEDYVQAHNQKS